MQILIQSNKILCSDSEMSLKKGNRLKSLSLCDDFPLRSPRSKSVLSTKKLEDTSKIMKYIDDNVIGKGVAFLGPYGRRKGKEISFYFQINIFHLHKK